MTTATAATTQMCSTCGQDKPVEDFALRSKTGTRRQAKCRQCTKEYNRAYHAANKAKINPRNQATSKDHRTTLLAMVDQVRASATCGSCGAGNDADIILLPPQGLTDGRNLSEVIRHGWSTSRFTQLLETTLATPGAVLCRTCVGRLNGPRAHEVNTQTNGS